MEVGDGSLADDLGEGVVAPMTAGCGTTGAPLVGLGEEVEDEPTVDAAEPIASYYP